jgi:CHASE2 domain-containing sensor protein
MGRKQQLRDKRLLRKRLKEMRLKEGFWKRLWRALPALLVTGLLTVVLVRVNALDELAAYGQDILTSLSVPPKGSDVAIVMTDNKDYKEYFKATSPLEPAALQELISAIASGDPKVIGVDIDTSDQRFRDFQIGKSWPPIIWARPYYDTVLGTQQNPMSEEPVPLDVLGGKDMDLNDDYSGLPAMISVNGVTRFYQRMIETNIGALPSFPWVIVKKISPNIDKDRVETTDQLVIKFAGDPESRHRANLSALQILEFYRKKSWPNPSPIKDKIVLLGGSYLGSGNRDQKDTPLGKMYGVQILASVVETELEGGGIKRPDEEHRAES